MKFAPAPEQLDFARAVSELLAAADTPAVARSWAAGDTEPGRKLWARLAELGVTALATPEEFGGFGATAVDLVLAFEQLGRAAVPGPYVETVAVLPVALAGTPDADRLAGLADGTSLGTIAAPPWSAYAVDAAGANLRYLLREGRLHRAEVAGEVSSLDPTRKLAPLRAEADLGEIDADAVLRSGALATAAQILGAGQAVLDRSVKYAKQRTQFGKPIGSFQAVKHLLADAAVGLDLARPLLFGAAIAGEADVARDVSAAKVACTDAAYRASRAALQVHGAIGYTAEHDLSLWLTKIRALTGAWGTQRAHRDRVLAAIRPSGGSG